jgi:uncharacterized membrane protein YfcA
MRWWLLLSALVVASVTITPSVTAASSDDKCVSDNSFFCPVCEGSQVADCLDCTGYLNSDPSHNICFDRKLFNSKNTDEDNPDDHYHYLAIDLVGMVVWFIAAGIATACGVGGGGIYVPLGIILLNFAPKPSSGLSQASIFGASLGGLLLNLRNRHPNHHIQDGSRSSKTTSKDYTRPLIDYDMALFLAPMEMAGAVLGVLIQKVLPNWLYLTLAAIILGLTAFKTYNKYFSTRQKERELAEEAAGAEDGNGATPQDLDGEHPQAVGDEEAAAPTHGAPHKLDWSAPSDFLTPYNNKSTTSLTSLNVTPQQSMSVHDEAVEVTEEGPPPEQPTQEAATATATATGDNNNNKAKVDDEAEPTTTGTSSASASNPEVEEEEEDKDMLRLRQEWLEKDMRQYPKEKLSALGILWLGLMILTFMKGGKGVESIVGITCTSPWYGVLIAVQFAWTLGFALFFGLKLVRQQRAKDACRYPQLDCDVYWDAEKLRFYALFTFFAGIVAGLIGIGGGMVLGPLMLVMGIHPRVSSATTATMIVLTSSSVAVLFVTAGLVPWEYAVFFFFICLSGALVGKTYIDGYVKRTGKASLLIFLLATIIAFATVGCLVIVLTRLAEADWCFEGFKKFCAADEDNLDECPVDRFLFGQATDWVE